MKKWSIILRYGLALVFLYSGFLKVFNLQAFAGVVKTINILPAVTDRPAVIMIPLMEVFSGFALTLKLWLKPVLWLINIMLLGFIAILVVAVFHETYRGCGCFSFARSIGNWEGIIAILRDLLLIAGSVFLLRQERNEENRSTESRPHT